MSFTTSRKYDVQGLCGLVSAIIGIVGAQIVMLGIIALAIGSSHDQIVGGLMFVFGLLLTCLGIFIWDTGQKKKSVGVAVDHASSLS